MSENPSLRVGDADRAHAVQQLQSQAAAGRLTQTELAERTHQAQTATYAGDLDSLFRDLPGGRGALPQQSWESLPPGPSGIDDARYPGQGLANPALAAVAAPPGHVGMTRQEELNLRRQRRYEERMDRENNPRGWAYSLIPVLYVVAGLGFVLGWEHWWIVCVVLTLVNTFLVAPLLRAWIIRGRRP